MDKALPILIMIESLAAGAVYACTGDWGRALYWLSAGCLNMAVIFFIR